jgi:hypothetical protein
VQSVTEIDPASISDAEAKLAGHRSADAVRQQLRGEPRWPVYRVQFTKLDDPDPRDVLANEADLGPDEIAAIDARLDRLDRASRHGAWTRRYLELIAERPEVRAPDLAAEVGRETQPFKLDVRKLKNLGLTISLNPGYRLSPRGRAYLEAISE